MANDLPEGFRVKSAQPALPAGFRMKEAAPSSTVDAAASFAAGVPRGIVETAMFPVTASRLMRDAGGYVYDKAENLVRSALGFDPVSDETRTQRAELEAQMPSTAVNEAIFGGQDAVRGAMDSVL